MAKRSVQNRDLSKLLVVLPNWVGDVVLATPALRALREQLPNSEITYLLRPYVRDVLGGCPWVDRTEVWPEPGHNSAWGTLRVARQLCRHGYSGVLLLTNSFRTALLARLLGAKHRIGYARDYRSALLSERLQPSRVNGKFAVESMLQYYERLAQRLGCTEAAGRLELFTDPESDADVAGWWSELGIADDQVVVVLNPGGAFGPSKLYPADRFAAVGDALAADLGARVLITGGPQDGEMVAAVQQACREPATALLPPQLNLKRLKSLIARSSLLITNDTGPRHFAIAFDVPVVTIFGPTHPGWTESHYEFERKVMVPVDCGPCQKPVCPLDHRCMTGIMPEMVVAEAKTLLAARRGR